MQALLFEVFQIDTLNECEGCSPTEWMHPHPTTYTLHPVPYTLHPTPYTLHPTPYTLHPVPSTLHPTPDTLRPTPCRYHSPLSLCKQAALPEAAAPAIAPPWYIP